MCYIEVYTTRYIEQNKTNGLKEGNNSDTMVMPRSLGNNLSMVNFMEKSPF
jgi:hypothetical protein